jgi:negative regulator of sigma E activity
MQNRIDILNELKAISSTLFQLNEKETLPKVPSNYFADLSKSVLNKIEITDELKAVSEIVLNAKSAEIKPIVPVNYFADLTENIIAQTQNESNILSSLKKEIEVPANYFNSFADNIIDKIKKEEQTISEGKIIALQPQKTTIVKLFSRVAIAASIVGVLFFGIKNYNQSNALTNNCEDGIACLTQDEIYNYMNDNSEQFELQQVQDAVAPMIEKAAIKIEKHEAEKYIEQNKTDLSFENASTDIF